MEKLLEELDYRETPMGELVLQRRRFLALGGTVAYEVRLGDAYLMSSLFHESEVQLATLGLGALGGGAGSGRSGVGVGSGGSSTAGLEVVVGGLGLGYTAAAVLDHPGVSQLTVVEYLEPVIDWHRQGLVPNGERLTGDARCTYLKGDFFELARTDGFDPEQPGRRFDAVLLDIDHTPTDVLSPAHADLYTPEGLRRLERFLKPGGVFALWSNDAPEDGFLEVLREVFGEAEGHRIEFPNPLQETAAVNGVYLARSARTPQKA